VNTYRVSFGGWLEEDCETEDDACVNSFDKLRGALGPNNEDATPRAYDWHIDEVDFEDGLWFVDFSGAFRVKALGEDNAFGIVFGILNDQLSPLCNGGAVGDWEVTNVEDATSLTEVEK
jgi:hypothetical protein